MAKEWEQREGETDKAYAGFCSYAEMPPGERSLRKAWVLHVAKRATTQPQSGDRKTTHLPGYWSDWSEAHQWPERARAKDQFEAEQLRLARQKIDRQELLRYQKKQREIYDDLLSLSADVRAKAKTVVEKMKTEDQSPAVATMIVGAALNASRTALAIGAEVVGLEDVVAAVAETATDPDNGDLAIALADEADLLDSAGGEAVNNDTEG